jgi:hypothetical protein
MEQKPYRTRARSTTANKKTLAMLNADALPEPPDDITLLKKERVVFDAIMRSQKRDEWTDVLRYLACRLAKAEIELRKVDDMLKQQGMTVIAQSGVYAGYEIPNPMLKHRADIERQMVTMMRGCGLANFASQTVKIKNDKDAANEMAAHNNNAELADVLTLLQPSRAAKAN